MAVFKDNLSPNFNDRPSGCGVDTVVIHYTGMKSSGDALERLCSSEAKVSSHYLIDTNGDLYKLVDENKRAWHAGISHWAGRDNVNDYSIGIELQNSGHEYGYHQFLKEQMQCLIDLLAEITTNYNILPYNIVGHSDIAPERKMDPGELFDWKYLADNGLSIWPSKNYSVKSGGRVIARAGDDNQYIGTIQKKLADFGYNLQVSNVFDYQTINVVTAFRRRFMPDCLHPVWDERAEIILSDLLGKLSTCE